MNAPDTRSASMERVQRALTDAGLTGHVREMPATTRTANEAAAAIGCTVAAIVKSLVFRATISSHAIVVLASGVNRVNERTVSELIGEPIERATPEFVREHTGFAIGGVPPLGHRHKLRTIMDRDLLQHGTVWAAAGTPFAVFPITPHELASATDATVIDVAQ